MNPYEVLHLKPGATEAEVQQAYRDLVKVWHPDRFVNDARLQKIAHEKLSEMNRAYRLLVDRGRATPSAGPERTAHPAPHVSQAQTGMSFFIILSALLLGVLIVLCIGVYRFLEAPMSALSSINADAQRVAQRTGPNIIDEFRGWNGVIPQGLDRLLNSYRLPTAPRSVEISRGTSATGRQSMRPRSASLLRPGFGEIRVRNRTGEEIQVFLASTRAQAIVLRLLPLAPQEDGTLDGLGPDVYLLNVSFQDKKRQPMRLGPFMMVEIQSAKGVQADHYDVILRPSSAMADLRKH